MTNNVENQVATAMQTILAFFTLNINELSLADQFAYMGILAKFSEMVKPFVEKYGGSVDELERRFKENEEKQKMENFVEIMKALNDRKE